MLFLIPMLSDLALSLLILHLNAQCIGNATEMEGGFGEDPFDF